MKPITDQSQMFDPLHEEFLQQMLSSVTSPSPSWRSDIYAEADKPQPPWDPLSQTSMSLMLQQRLIASFAGNGNCLRSPTGGLLPLPLSLNSGADQHQAVALDDYPNFTNDISGESLYNEWISQSSHEPQHFQQRQEEAVEARNLGAKTQPAVSGSTGTRGGGTAAQPTQQKVRARRGQATDPHSIAERLRRERIAQRMKGLQELVPNANKTDKASMLEEIIDYVKFLQLQVKVLSMSRLGASAAIAAPLLGEMFSKGGGDSIKVNARSSNRTNTAPADNDDSMTATEQQVAKLMEEDVGSAMQYLQGKGLCLLPLSLATEISTATCNMNLKRHGQDLNRNDLLMGSGDRGVEEGGGPISSIDRPVSHD